MLILTIQGMISFLFVFLRGFQHQNVIGGKYAAAFGVSYVLAATEVAVISLVVKSGWWSVLPVGTGGAFGIVASMWLYRATEERGLFATFVYQLRRLTLRPVKGQHSTTQQDEPL